jgi:regulatory protein
VKDRPDTAIELRARALRLLARREHSRLELARKLRVHAESEAALCFLLDSLQERKQLSDERYAEERARWLARKYGAAKIRHDLKSKGVDPELVERISSKDDLERAAAILQRKFRDPATTREERARRMRFLLGRGFSHEIIRSALGAPAGADPQD